MKSFLVAPVAFLSSLALVVAIGCGGGGDAPSSPSASSTTAARPTPPVGAIVVSATSFKYTPSTLTLKVGVATTLFVTNDSPDDDHDIKSDIPIAALSYAHADNDPAEITQNIQENKLDVDFNAGGWAQVTFTPTKSGTYAFACGEGNHKEKGMVGTFVVTQ